MKKIIFLLLLPMFALAGLPPTASKLNGEANYSTTFNFDFSIFSGSHTGTTVTPNILLSRGGGTGLDGSSAANGSLLIGNGTGYSLNPLTGTANQVNVTNGAGTITLSTPQDIATTSSPTFASPTITGDITLSNAAYDSIQVGKTITTNSSTGVISGSVMAVNGGDNTKFDISAGTGLIVDYSTPTAPTVKRITIGPFTAQTVTNLASADFTWILIDNTGAIVQQNTVPTPDQRRTMINLGRLNHSTRTSISFANTLPDLEFSPISQAGDLMDSLGPFNISGNVITANGANLSMNKSAGTMFQKSFDYSTIPNNPHVITTAGLTALSFAYQNQTGGPGGSVTVLDPTTYDVAGTTTTVPASNNATVQRVYLFGSNTIRVQRGQAFYANFATALQDYAQESFVESPLISGFSVPIAFIVMTKSCTSLQNTTCSKIIMAGKFGGTVGGAGSGGTTNLQQSYNNSTQPQIVVNSTQGGIQVRDASTPIAASLFAIQDNGGTTNFFNVSTSGTTSSNFVGSGTVGAVRVHNLTTTQRNALTPAAGMIVYDTTLAQFYCYSAAWSTCANKPVLSAQTTLAASGTITISLTDLDQRIRVSGNGAAVTLSSTPFGSSDPLDGTRITLIGNDDTNTVTLPLNDAANGIIRYEKTLGRGDTITYEYNASLDRYVIVGFGN
jgi:hypothetical protein